MDTIGIYEYNSKDLIGHGAFAVVYKGRVKMVSPVFLIFEDNFTWNRNMKKHLQIGMF